VIVGAILTQNTAWGNVEKAIANLKEAELLDLGRLDRVAEEALGEIIRPAGTFRVKARRLKALIGFIQSRFGGDLDRMFGESVARLRLELLAVPGVGPETADAILLYAGNLPVFVVDAYTKRVLRRHHLIDDGASYHDVQALFHSQLPPDPSCFNEYHALIVELGKRHCKVRAICEGCPLESHPHDPTL
jgi:endonuclease-3 related protein